MLPSSASKNPLKVPPEMLTVLLATSKKVPKVPPETLTTLPLSALNKKPKVPSEMVTSLLLSAELKILIRVATCLQEMTFLRSLGKQPFRLNLRAHGRFETNWFECSKPKKCYLEGK